MLRLTHEIVTVVVGKADVADQHIELFVLQKFQRALRRISRNDFMSALAQKARENSARVGVIIDQKETQTSPRWRIPSCLIGRCNHGFAQKIEKNSKGCAAIPSFAVNSDRAAVKIEQSLRNGQTETQSPEFSGNGACALVEGLEDAALPLRLNANPGIGDFKYELPSFIRRADGDAA